MLTPEACDRWNPEPETSRSVRQPILSPPPCPVPVPSAGRRGFPAPTSKPALRQGHWSEWHRIARYWPDRIPCGVFIHLFICVHAHLQLMFSFMFLRLGGHGQPPALLCPRGFSIWNDPFPDVRTMSHLNRPEGGPPQGPRETILVLRDLPSGRPHPSQCRHTACQPQAASVQARSPLGPFRFDDPPADLEAP